MVRLEGVAKDLWTGLLVWGKAPDPNEPWWPAELLDPFRLPPGRTLTPNHLAGTTSGLGPLHLESLGGLEQCRGQSL